MLKVGGISSMSEWTTWDEIRKKIPVNEKRVAKYIEMMHAAIDGVKLAELRQIRRLTQTQMAKKLKIDQSNVSRIERGKFDAVEIRTLRKYVEALGGELEIRVKIDDLSQRLIDSEYEKEMERKFAREEAVKKRKRAPTRSAPKAKSVAKRRTSKKVSARVAPSRRRSR
jgi:transcriptional regulator with XRE-family HTH domain